MLFCFLLDVVKYLDVAAKLAALPIWLAVPFLCPTFP